MSLAASASPRHLARIAGRDRHRGGGLVIQFAPLFLLGNGFDASVFPTTQLHALTSLTGQLSQAAYILHTSVLRPRYSLSVLPAA